MKIPYEEVTSLIGYFKGRQHVKESEREKCREASSENEYAYNSFMLAQGYILCCDEVIRKLEELLHKSK